MAQKAHRWWRHPGAQSKEAEMPNILSFFLGNRNLGFCQSNTAWSKDYISQLPL